MSVIPKDQIVHKGVEKLFNVLNANLTDPRTTEEQTRKPRNSETAMVREGSYPDKFHVWPHVVVLYVGGAAPRVGGYGDFFDFLARFGIDIIANKTKYVDNLIDQVFHTLRTNRSDLSDYGMRSLNFVNFMPSPYSAMLGELHGTLIQVEFNIDAIT